MGRDISTQISHSSIMLSSPQNRIKLLIPSLHRPSHVTSLVFLLRSAFNYFARLSLCEPLPTLPPDPRLPATPNTNKTTHLPPPFLYAKYGNRHTFPMPTDRPTHESKNSHRLPQLPRSATAAKEGLLMAASILRSKLDSRLATMCAEKRRW